MNEKIYNNVPENVQIEEIRKIVQLRKNEANPHNDTYIRRLELYPQFLLMPYWIEFFETVYMLKTPYIKGKILDFGCGSGHLDVVLAREGKDITGIDLSSIAIDIANYIRSIENEDIKSRLKFILQDVTSEPEVYHEYDCCISTHVFEHIPDISLIMEGLRKRLKKNAQMIVSVPIGYAYNDSDHVHHFMDEEHLRSHFAPYVQVVAIERDTANLVFKAILQF